MDEIRTVEAEIEGDRYNWWYVCSECHTYLRSNDRICRGCHGKILWAGLPQPERQIYTGEQTEPAE